jgi:predicted dehydrogenase
MQLRDVMSDLRFAAFGAGFWTRFQLSGWQEIPGARCVAIYNRTLEKAQAYAREFQIPAVYDDVEALLSNEKFDFVDIITGPETHEQLALQALRHRLPVICQKPLAPSLAAAARMTAAFENEDVPLLVNENWRWQTTIRQVKNQLDNAPIGRPFRARVDMISGFPVFRNQPFLKDLSQFILTDLGTHILDVCRFLFGEVRSVYCKTSKVHDDIAGEDVATVVLETNSGVTVVASMAYAENFLEDECFPQTRIFVEAPHGSLELKSGYRIHVTTQDGTREQIAAPAHYSWADPAYDVVHSSIVPCQANLLHALMGIETAETAARDNLKTLRLVDASYESAQSGQAVLFQ